MEYSRFNYRLYFNRYLNVKLNPLNHVLNQMFAPNTDELTFSTKMWAYSN